MKKILRKFEVFAKIMFKHAVSTVQLPIRYAEFKASQF